MLTPSHPFALTLASMVALSASALAASLSRRDAGSPLAKGAPSRLVPSLVVLLVFLGAGHALLPRLHPGAAIVASLLAAGLVLPLRSGSQGLVARALAAERLLVLGTSPLARKIAEEVQSAPLSYRVVAFVDERDVGAAGEASRGWPPFEPVVRRLEQLDRLIGQFRPDRLVVALSERRGRLPVWLLLSSCASGLPVEDGIEFYERLTHKLAIESLTPSFLIFRRVFQKSRGQIALRRALSVAVAAVGLVLAAPLMALVALVVKLDSPGPVFFVQERVGLGGRIFRLVKFRTMRGSLPAAGSVWCRDDLPRLTRVGAWLRNLHIDELPQLVNVLRGDMDMVGPRPEMACNVQTMTEQIPYYGLRHTVRPGLTGWAQVNQGYSVSQAEVTEKMRYDLYYIKHMSVWLDLKILAATVRLVLLGGRRS